jgi:enamine deaminase RidA (YjgF/YER057c/UK114 family)
MKHERLHPFNTRDVYPYQTLDNDICMVVKAGNRLFMRGQTGLALHHLVAPEDAAAQADQAMQNARRLLDEAGSSLDEVCKLRVYIGDRAYREPVYQVVGQALKGVFPVGTGLIVDGFASPWMLVEIDVDAVVQDGANT